MQQKIVIRKKALANRKKKYFEISSQFFNPLVQLLKKKNKNSTNILSLYYPSNFEVNVLSFFQFIKKIKIKIKILLPVTESDNQMNFVE